jgi:hypothetical protein
MFNVVISSFRQVRRSKTMLAASHTQKCIVVRLCRVRIPIPSVESFLSSLSGPYTLLCLTARLLASRNFGGGLLERTSQPVWDVFVLALFALSARSPHEIPIFDLPIYLQVSSPADEPRVYDQRPNVPGLFPMWQGI